MLIRQSAFEPFAGKMLKGGLHCHTTRSDGKGDPADVMRIYGEKGFDFLAITDHRRYNYTNFAPETGLLIVPGMEMDRNLSSDEGMCFHTVSIGPSREDGNGFEQDQTFESGLVKDQYEYQAVLDMLHANGNRTIYCHPDWSCTPARSYENMKGNFAMEIWNTGCVLENHMDMNAMGWDELLLQGKRIFGVATDDGHAMNQHGLGWVRVRAEKELSAILDALERGDFYASTGPEIYDFYVEDGVAHLACSPCASICFLTGRRPSQLTQGENLTCAEAKLRLDYGYVRATVLDAEGNRAWTNPIFLDGAAK